MRKLFGKISGMLASSCEKEARQQASLLCVPVADAKNSFGDQKTICLERVDRQ